MEVSASGSQVCGLTDDGDVYCWQDSRTHRESAKTPGPFWIESQVKLATITLGDRHGCGLTRRGEPFCWGTDDERLGASGDLGDTTRRAYRVDFREELVEIAAGYDHTCGRSKEGGIWCWGNNAGGQLGRDSDLLIDSYAQCSSLASCQEGNDWTRPGPSHRHFQHRGDEEKQRPHPVQWDQPFVSVVAGTQFSCGLDQLGMVVCWGAGLCESAVAEHGGGLPGSPMALEWEQGFDQIYANDHELCGRTAAGELWCNLLEAPILLSSEDNYVMAAVGDRSRCGVTESSQLRCWEGPCALTPLKPFGYTPGGQEQPLQGVLSLAAGAGFGCVIHAAGELWCWGESLHEFDGFGQAGVWRVAHSDDPETEEVIVDDVVVSPPRDLSFRPELACWIDQDERVHCVADHTHFLSSAEAESDAIDVAVGVRHACFLRRSGEVYCAGDNQLGQLGQENLLRRQSFAPLRTSARFVQLSSGHVHSCALDGDGAVLCWGDNAFGQVGDGPAQVSYSPIIAGTGNYQQVVTGAHHTCALTLDGEVDCWGDNHRGQLGNGTLHTTGRASGVESISPFVQIAAGRIHSCGLREDGLVLCWGDNRRGQLGREDLNESPLPEQIITPGGEVHFVDLVAEGDLSCALSADDGIYCWGERRPRALHLMETASPSHLRLGAAILCVWSVDKNAPSECISLCLNPDHSQEHCASHLQTPSVRPRWMELLPGFIGVSAQEIEALPWSPPRRLLIMGAEQ